jgi:type IV secretion system protein VirB10
MMPPQTEKHVRMLSFALPAQQQQREAQADPTASRAAMPTGGNPGATSIAYKGTQIPVAKAGAANDTTLWLMPGIYHCVLDTAVSSEISGPFMCHVSEAIRSDAGAVLMERGTRIVGQYQSEIHQGQSRIPTLAVTAWTPNGVPVPLNSSMADGLGRVGMDGEVNNHYLQRFGSSVLLLLTQGALGAAQAALQHGNNNTYLQTGGFESAATEALRNSINIPPTITKNQGEDVAFFVTMPVDFSAAYELHVAR